MRKLTTGLVIAASMLAIAGCAKQAEEPTAMSSEADATAATAEASAAGDVSGASAAASDASDPNGNPIKP